MVQCCVLGCNNRSDAKFEDVTFHSFPKDLALRRMWIRSTGRSNWKPTKNSRICSKHFVDNSFRKTQRLTFLKAYSAPSLQVHNFRSNPVVTSKMDDEDLFFYFKMLLKQIIRDAKLIDVPKLQILIEKAIEMMDIMKSGAKFTTDKLLTDQLEFQDTLKRRSCENNLNQFKPMDPVTTIENQFSVSENVECTSPKIVNSFSLATASNENLVKDTKDKKRGIENVAPSRSGIEQKATQITEDNSAKFNRSLSTRPSFNDSYKEFVDKTIKASLCVGKKHKREPKEWKNGSNLIIIRDTETTLNTSNCNNFGLIPNNASINNVLETTKIVKIKTEAINDSTPKITSVINGTPSNLLSHVTSLTPKVVSKVDTAPIKVVTVVPNTAPKLTYDVNATFKVDPEATQAKPKAIVEDLNDKSSMVISPKAKKRKSDYTYEVQEQDNDCNILILKF